MRTQHQQSGMPAAVMRAIGEVFEPAMKLMVDAITAMVLGVFFVIQSVSIIITLDTIVGAILKVSQALLYSAISSYTTFLSSERERRVVVYAFLDFVMNITWAEITCRLNSVVIREFFVMPALCFVVIHVAMSAFTSRLALDIADQSLQVMVALLLLAQALMFIFTLTHTPGSTHLAIVFLLRVNIDGHLLGLELLLRSFLPTLEADGSIFFILGNIFRRAFWLVLTAVQCMTRDKRDRGMVLMLIFHDCLGIVVPIRQLFAKLHNDRVIARTFPLLSSDEVAALGNDSCSVCLNEHNSDSRRLNCGHILHSGCLQRVLSAVSAVPRSASPNVARCPICRTQILSDATTSSSGHPMQQRQDANAAAPGGVNSFSPVSPAATSTVALNPVLQVRIITQGLLPRSVAMSATPSMSHRTRGTIAQLSPSMPSPALRALFSVDSRSYDPPRRDMHAQLGQSQPLQQSSHQSEQQHQWTPLSAPEFNPQFASVEQSPPPPLAPVGEEQASASVHARADEEPVRAQTTEPDRPSSVVAVEDEVWSMLQRMDEDEGLRETACSQDLPTNTVATCSSPVYPPQPLLGKRARPDSLCEETVEEEPGFEQSHSNASSDACDASDAEQQEDPSETHATLRDEIQHKAKRQRR